MFLPENDLERALVRAMEDPDVRVQFLKDLLDAELVFALVAGQEDAESFEVPELEDRGVGFVPIFTHEKRAGQVFGDETMKFVRQTFRQIAEQLQGANFVLNPGSDAGREFMAEEVAAMFAGDFASVAEGDDEDGPPLPTAVARPAPMPTHLTTALAKMFGAMREVKSAYVAQAVFPDPDGTKRLVIGIETDGDLDFILDRVSPLLDRVAKPSDVIDFVQIPGSPLDGYFQRDVAPFYRKAES